MFFLRAGGAWLLRSILSCSPGCGRACRRLLQWHVLCWFAGHGAPRAVLPSISCRPMNGELCTVDASDAVLPDLVYF